jgi:hypothetical protein
MGREHNATSLKFSYQIGLPEPEYIRLREGRFCKDFSGIAHRSESIPWPELSEVQSTSDALQLGEHLTNPA